MCVGSWGETCDESNSRCADHQGAQAGFGQLLGYLAPALELLQPCFAPGAWNSSAAALPDLGCAEAALQAACTSVLIESRAGKAHVNSLKWSKGRMVGILPGPESINLQASWVCRSLLVGIDQNKSSSGNCRTTECQQDESKLEYLA